MTENYSIIETIEIKIRIRKYVQFLLSYKKHAFIFIFITSCLGFGYAILKKPIYKGVISFLVNEPDKGMSSSILSLAGQLGISAGPSISLNDDKIIFLFNTRKILGSALIKNRINEEGTNELLANRFIKYYKLEKAWEKDTSMFGFTSFKGTNYEKLSFQENKALDKILFILNNSKVLNIDAVKKKSLVSSSSGIITMNLSTKDEWLSKNYLEEIYNELSSFYINNTINRYLDNYNLIAERADSLSDLIKEKENQLAIITDANYRLIRAQGKVEEYRLKKDIEILNLIFAEVVKNKELAKFSLDQQRPAFQILDNQPYPLEKIKTSKIISILVGFFVGFLLFLITYSIKYYNLKSLS